MKKHIPLAMLAGACVAFSPASYAINKCTTPEGKVIYTDDPCPQASKKTELRVNTSSPDQAGRSSAEIETKLLKSMQTSRRSNDVVKELESLDWQISRIGTGRDAEIARLNERKSRANNNLAGATLEQSISTEIHAVNGTHDSKLKVIQEKQKALRSELESIKAGK